MSWSCRSPEGESVSVEKEPDCLRLVGGRPAKSTNSPALICWAVGAATNGWRLTRELHSLSREFLGERSWFCP